MIVRRWRSSLVAIGLQQSRFIVPARRNGGSTNKLAILPPLLSREWHVKGRRRGEVGSNSASPTPRSTFGITR